MDSDSSPFADLDSYLDLSRVSGLALSPDGGRLVVEVSILDEKRTAYLRSLWEVDPAGERPARRITWGPKSEFAPAFLPDGSLSFISARPAPDADEDDDSPATLWLLPRKGGEAQPLASRPGGIAAVAVAQDSGTLILASPTLPSATSAQQDAELRAARKERKVGAVLHDSYPVRFWDADLGPDRPRLFAGQPNLTAGEQTGDQPRVLRDLTGHIGRALSGETDWGVSPDGSTVVACWSQAEPGGSARNILLTIDVATGQRRVLRDDPAFEYFAAAFSPDGGRIAVLLERRAEPGGRGISRRLAVLDLASDQLADVAPGWDRWPGSTPVWTPDGEALLVIGDDQGRAPIWRVELGTGRAFRLTVDDAAYSDLQLTRDGAQLYALRSAVDAPPAPVRLDPARADQSPTLLRGPVEPPLLPGTLTELSTLADDGSTVRGWLTLPAGAGPGQPVPLLIWIHGGPLHSWNSWSWRWNPWLAVAAGYAVLLPDPALSTGYGQAAIDRGWGRWGAESYTDLMAITDAAQARDDIDADRTAAMGGSFGGYMANWIAGHTDRFRGIVSHAGLWSLDQFGPTTDAAHYWRREMTAEMAATNSPQQFVSQIRTPMLVIHGDRDYRVPVGEALRLWAELAEQDGSPDGVLPHKFLLFPDEGHWVLKPQNAKLWYQTVFAFLAHTVLGEAWAAPELVS